MKPIVIELAEYVKSGTPGRTLSPLVEQVGATEIRVVAIKLLGWLKAMGRTGKPKVLGFDERYTWCQNLTVLMSDVSELRELFEVKRSCIDFCSSVPVDERIAVQKYVDVHYNPKLRV